MCFTVLVWVVGMMMVIMIIVIGMGMVGMGTGAGGDEGIEIFIIDMSYDRV